MELEILFIDNTGRPTYVLLIPDPIEADKITAEGIMKFLDDLNLSPESKLVLIIAWKFRAAVQCEFSREEFMTGMTELWYVYLKVLGLICLTVYGLQNYSCKM